PAGAGPPFPRQGVLWMNRLRLLGCLGGMLLAASVVQAQFSPRCVDGQRYLPPNCPTPYMPGTTMPGTPPSTTPPVIPSPQPATGTTPEMSSAGLGSSFASAPEGGTQAPSSFNPAMFGDFIGVQRSRVVR